MSRLLAAVIVAVFAAVAPAIAPAAPLAPEMLTLRLPDLGPNYVLGSSRCGDRSTTEERWWPSTLPALSERFPNHGCVIAFAKGWPVPDGSRYVPDYVMSAAFTFADAAGPAAALQRPRAMAARILDADRRGDFRLLTVSAAVGDEVRVLRLGGYPVPGTVLMWRSGSVLALVLAATRTNHDTTQAALALAAAQQARIASPTPLETTDLDDMEVPLDDPRLGVPVQWLGRHVPAQSRLPSLRLLSVDGPDFDNPRVEPRAKLQYGTRGLMDYVDLSLWKPRGIRHELRSPLLRRFCVRTFDAGVEGVDAKLVGYVDPVPRRCARRRPNTWTAVAFFRSVAVTIEASACDGCRRKGLYSSPAGLRAIVRALRPRTP